MAVYYDGGGPEVTIVPSLALEKAGPINLRINLKSINIYSINNTLWGFLRDVTHVRPLVSEKTS